MAFFAHFKALPFKSMSNNSMKKITRKRQDLDLQIDYYPSEGHVCVPETASSYLFFGGGDRNESTWANANRVFRLSFHVEKDDINVKDIQEIALSGGIFPPLHGSAALKKDSNVFVWGGLNMEDYQTTNELYILNFKREDSAQVVIIQDENGISGRKMFSVPPDRCGHTLTMYNGKVIMHGGLNVCFPNPQEMSDSYFYAFDLDDLMWEKLSYLPDVPARAYHSCNVFHINGISSIAYLGGVQKAGSEITRVSIYDLVILKFVEDKYEVEFVTIPCSVPHPLSYHSSTYIEPFIVVVCGANGIDTNGSCKLIHINMFDKTCTNVDLQQQFCTVGHSSLKLDDDCILVCSGSTKHFFTYSSKRLTPSACDLLDKCKISQSSEIFPIHWIFCDGKCKSWFHQFCVGILGQTVKGKYRCVSCSSKKKKK